MAVEIVAPQIGETVAGLKLTAWLKREGDPIKRGELLCKVASSESVVEVVASADGILAQIMIPEGSVVTAQQVLGIMRQPAELQGHATLEFRPEGTVSKQIAVSPKARQLARELDIDLSSITGTGIDGMIIAQDVLALVKAATPPTAVRPAQYPSEKPSQQIAARTLASKQQVPHFYLLVDVNMTQANQLRAYCTTKRGWEHPPTYTDIMVRACALALAETPTVNVTFIEDTLVPRVGVSIGVAIHTDTGVMMPVLAGADKLNLRETSQALRGMAERTRQNRLAPSDLGQKSMVISNLGMYAVDTFIADIDMPDPMTLAVGRIMEKPVVLSGVVVPQPMCTLTLSVDHRALDGVPAAQFLERVKDHLESPFEIVG